MSSSVHRGSQIDEPFEADRRLPIEASPPDVASILRDVALYGIAVVPNAFPPDAIDEARAFCETAVERNGGEYCTFKGSEGLPGPILGALPDANWFQNLCTALYAGLTRKLPPPVEFYQVLRCLTGETGRAESGYFHYDSYVVTVLVPIAMPASGTEGHFILFPDRRPIRHNYLLNVFEKAILDRKLVQRLIHRIAKSSSKLIRVELIPGNMYIFRGYNSLHTNEPCDPATLRATALFHYGNPHSDARSRHLLKRGGRISGKPRQQR